MRGGNGWLLDWVVAGLVTLLFIVVGVASLAETADNIARRYEIKHGSKS